MFELVTRLVIWLLLGYFIWYVLLQLIPQINVKWLLPILLLVLIIMGIAFPDDRSISSIWNVISFPLKPIGLCIVFLLIGSTQLKEKTIPKKVKNVLFSVLIILLFASVPWISDRLEYAIIRSNLDHSEICPNNPDYTARPNQSKLIVLLANAVTQPGGPYRPEEQIFEMSDRLLQTAQEYQRNSGDILLEDRVLIASRKKPASETERIPSEFELIRDQLITLGIPRVGIFDLNLIPEANTFNVNRTIAAITEYIDSRNLSNYQIIIIASPIDVGRVKLTLEKALNTREGRQTRTITVIPSAWNLSNKLCQKQKSYPDLVDLIPRDYSVLRSSQVLDEFFTSSYYFLRGWLTPCWNCWERVRYSTNGET
jgi:hypothetical protein